MQYNAALNGAQVIAPNFDRIPTELRFYRSFVVWRYEDNGRAKPAKVPYSPNGSRASVTNPQTWVGFEEVRSAYERGGFDGVGFVLSDADPFTFIDLDDCDGSRECLDLQNEIFEATSSYAERSPSGTGLHILTNGTIPTGKRRGKVEVYPTERFMTLTGSVYREAPIADESMYLMALWHRMGGSRDEATFHGVDQPVTMEDAEVLERMFAASNGAGEHARQLWEHPFDAKDYPSQSEADLALANYIAFQSRNREQTLRIFQAAPTYRAGKYQKRSDLLERLVGNAFDQQLGSVAPNHILEQLKEIVGAAQTTEQSRPEAPAGPFPITYAHMLTGRPIQPRRFHVADMVPYGDVTLLSGDGGTGKSFLGLQLAFATAGAVQWLGCGVRQGNAVMLSAEDDLDELHRRVVAIARMEGVRLDALPHKLALLPLAGLSAILVEQTRRGGLDLTQLAKTLGEFCTYEQPALLVLDTAADLFGGEENDRAQVRQFISLLRQLALTLDMTILLLSHPSVKGMDSGTGLSGSTAWNNSVRSRLYLKRQERGHLRSLEVMKANYGSTGQQLDLEFRDGAFVKVGHSVDADAHIVAANAGVDELFLKLLAEFDARGMQVSPSHNSPTRYAPKLMASHPGANGTKAHGFKTSMIRLLADGRLVEEMKQRDGRAVAIVRAAQ